MPVHWSGSGPLRVLVVGAGGVGGYYGAVLARRGHAVTVYARGEHRRILQERGVIEIRGGDDPFEAPVRVIDHGDPLPDVDLVLLAVKQYSLAEVLPVVRAAAERGATVLPLLNGVGVVESLVDAGVARDRVLGGLTQVSAARVAPGVIERRSTFQVVVIGEPDGTTSARTTRIVDAFRAAGVDARASTRIDVELWQKFVFIAAMGAVCGLARSAIGTVRAAPGAERLIGRAVDEVIAVARARGVVLPADEGARVRGVIAALPPAMKPSFLLDLEAGGPTELDALSGAVARMAESSGIDAPIHQTAATVLAVRHSTGTR